MYSKAFIAATLLGAAAALPAGSLPSLHKEETPYKAETPYKTETPYKAESTPSSSPYEKPASFEKPAAPQASQPAGPPPAAAPPAAPMGGPSGPPPWAKGGEERLADFDDLSPVPAVAIQSTGEYKDLYYQGFVTLEAGIGGTVPAGVIPESSPNAAAYGIYSELLEGPATIYADYHDSEVKDFDLTSLYFGCAANTAESVASLPVACTIKATAYDEEDHPVASQEFEYNPRGLASPMEKVEFGKGFSHVKKVQFDTTAVVDEVVATLFDDIEYTIYKTTPFDEFHH